MLRSRYCMLVVAMALAHVQPSVADAKQRRVVTVDLSTLTSQGDTVRGPVVLRLERVNRLRYDIHAGRLVTFTPGPALPLMPALPVARAAAAPATSAAPQPLPGGVEEAVRPPDPYSSEFRRLLAHLANLELRRSTEIEGRVSTAAALVQKARDLIEATVRASDGVLQADGPAQVLAQVSAVLPVVEMAQAARWPTADIVAFRGEIDLLEAELLALPHLESGAAAWPDWYQGTNKSSYDAMIARAGELRDYTAAVGVDSRPAEAFRALQGAVTYWQGILRGIKAGGKGAFTIALDERCGFGFGGSRSTKIDLLQIDRLAAAGTAPTIIEVATVECTTPLSLTTGFGFTSFVDEIEYGFVQSTKAGTDDKGNPTTTVVKRFAPVKSSDFRTSPLLLVNTRIVEWNDTLAVHATAGAVVDLKGDPGTDVEFVVGPSLSVRRSFFVTVAFQAARVSRLAGGFKVDDEVPSGVASPPLQKGLKGGLLIALTYRMKP